MGKDVGWLDWKGEAIEVFLLDGASLVSLSLEPEEGVCLCPRLARIRPSKARKQGQSYESRESMNRSPKSKHKFKILSCSIRIFELVRKSRSRLWGNGNLAELDRRRIQQIHGKTLFNLKGSLLNRQSGRGIGCLVLPLFRRSKHVIVLSKVRLPSSFWLNEKN